MLMTMLSKRKLSKVVIRCTLCSGYLGSSWKCSVDTHMMVIYNSVIPCCAKCIEIEVNFLFPLIQDLHLVLPIINYMWVNHLCLISEFRNVEVSDKIFPDVLSTSGKILSQTTSQFLSMERKMVRSFIHYNYNVG